MTNALVVEDEPQIAEYLIQLLKKNHPDIQVIGLAKTVNEAVKFIKDENPGLVFLDVELGMESSFDLFEKIPQLSAEIIFTTAHDKYALQAIRNACLEYLLKPIDPEELALAIQKFNERKKINLNQKRIELLLESINLLPDKFQKIAIPTVDGFEFVKIGDILYCQSESNYTWIYTAKNTKLLSSKTLKEFEAMLPQDTFYRTHKSYLVNLNCIKRYTRTDGNQLEMENGDMVEIASRRKEGFLNIIGRNEK